MYVTISTYNRCSVRLYLRLLLWGLLSYLRYLCLLAHCCVQHILCCVFVLSFFVLCTLCCPYLAIVCFRLVYPMLPVSRDCPFLIATSVFTNVLFKSYVYPKACINCYLSISTGLDNKRDDFNFPIVNFPYIDCNKQSLHTIAHTLNANLKFIFRLSTTSPFSEY